MTRQTPLIHRAAILLIATLATLAVPGAAVACGGLFCAQAPPTPAPPEPVDQNAERIVFEVLPGEIVAHVQIQYAGAADSFAWIVPVPAVPDVEESSAALFDELEGFTNPMVVLPQAEPCPQPSVANDGGGGCGGGCGDLEASLAASDGGDFGNNGAQGNNGVTVFDRDFTENFEYVVVGADDTMVLVEWLMDNGYNVSSNMTPVIDPYNGPDGKFLALKLRAGKEASDIVPIKMRYEADAPMIPIQLTAVAAQPQMGILTYIIADAPYTSSNFEVTSVDDTQILFDDESITNYFAQVARAADEADGRLFIEEFVGPVVGRLSGLEGDGTIVSRFYTRMSPQHMTEDPVFVPHQDPGHSKSRVLDLSDHPSLFRCNALISDRVPSECAFNYCGMGSTCAEIDGQATCMCPRGEVSQPIASPDGRQAVTCIPAENPVGVRGEDAGAGGIFDPCNDYDCGEGQCVLRGGFPTCMCDQGAASRTVDTRVTCVEVPDGAPTFGPGAGIESAPALAFDTPHPKRPLKPLYIGLLLPLAVVFGLRQWYRRGSP